MTSELEEYINELVQAEEKRKNLIKFQKDLKKNPGKYADLGKTINFDLANIRKNHE